MSTRRISTRSLGAALAGAAFVSLSCGAPVPDEGAASPAAATAVAPVGKGAVSASAKGNERVTLCHYDAVTGTYSDLVLPMTAVSGHLSHGDRPGSCTATCPCVTAQDIAAAASACPVAPVASCVATYSLGLFCPRTGGYDLLGYWDAVIGQPVCSWTTSDFNTFALPMDAAQFESCRSVIVMSSYYPAVCPT